MERLKNFFGDWWNYFQSEGVENLWEDFKEEGKYLIEEVKYFVLGVGKCIKFIGGIIVLGFEYGVPLVVDLIELLVFIIKSILYILFRVALGFISIWDREEYKKIQRKRWER